MPWQPVHIWFFWPPLAASPTGAPCAAAHEQVSEAAAASAKRKVWAIVRSEVGVLANPRPRVPRPQVPRPQAQKRCGILADQVRERHGDRSRYLSLSFTSFHSSASAGA